jgi:6-phosphogluconolactonase (cycloisomerase 2 family)
MLYNDFHKIWILFNEYGNIFQSVNNPIKYNIIKGVFNMKAFKTIVVLAVFFALTACGGGGSGSGSGGNGSGSTPTLVGYEITASSSAGSIQGEVYLNSVYSDGSVKTTFSISGVQGPNGMAQTTISGTTYIFINDTNGYSIDEYQINKTNGTLTQLPGVTGFSSMPGSEVVDHTGNYLFVGFNNGTISSYAIGSNGSLTYTGFSLTLNSSGETYCMTEDTTGGYLVAGVNAGSTYGIYVLADNQNGTLTLKNQLTGLSGSVINLAADPNTANGDYVYGGGGSEFDILNVSSFASGNSGALTFMSTGSANMWGGVYWIDPTGTWAYLSNYNSSTFAQTLTRYNISSNGSLSSGSVLSTNSSGSWISQEENYDSTNGFVLSTNPLFNSGGPIQALTENMTNGNLTIAGYGGSGAYTTHTFVSLTAP